MELINDDMVELYRVVCATQLRRIQNGICKVYLSPTLQLIDITDIYWLKDVSDDEQTTFVIRPVQNSVERLAAGFQ